MDINCYVVSNGEFESVTIPEKLLTELCKSLRSEGITTVHFATRNIQVEGVYIPAKACKNGLLVIPNIKE